MRVQIVHSKEIKLCPEHLNENSLRTLLATAIHSFTADHLNDMIELGFKKTFGSVENCDDEFFRIWIGLSKIQVVEFLDELPSLIIKRRELALLCYLAKLRSGAANEKIAIVFGLTRSTMERYMNVVRMAIKIDFVPQHMGFIHLSREDLKLHGTVTSDILFAAQNEVVTIWDGTYIYVQKSQNYAFQRKCYSCQKKRPLVKPMISVAPDGYILEIYGPYPATDNDASILKKILSSDCSPVFFLEKKDVFILDRGFRDTRNELRRNGFVPYIPASRGTSRTQLKWDEANESRRITKCRYIVEDINGRMKTQFRLFDHVYVNKSLSHFMDDFRNAGSIYNRFLHRTYNDEGNVDALYANTMLTRIKKPNYLATLINGEIRQANNRHRANTFDSIESDLIVFPRLTEDDLKLIALGTYQLKQAISYYSETVKGDGDYRMGFSLCKPNILTLHVAQKYKINVQDPQLIRCKLRSRHSGSVKYYTYVLTDKQPISGPPSIIEHYCNCKNGARTNGCCAHVMTVIWILGIGRHMDPSQIKIPGETLDIFFCECNPGNFFYSCF